MCFPTHYLYQQVEQIVRANIEQVQLILVETVEIAAIKNVG